MAVDGFFVFAGVGTFKIGFLLAGLLDGFNSGVFFLLVIFFFCEAFACFTFFFCFLCVFPVVGCFRDGLVFLVFCGADGEGLRFSPPPPFPPPPPPPPSPPPPPHHSFFIIIIIIFFSMLA